jgi:hypothetical protein
MQMIHFRERIALPLADDNLPCHQKMNDVSLNKLGKVIMG